MIRKFLSLSIFTATVLIAAFGQDVFGRQDIERWASRLESEGPYHAKLAWDQTDRAMTVLFADHRQSGLM